MKPLHTIVTTFEPDGDEIVMTVTRDGVVCERERFPILTEEQRKSIAANIADHWGMKKAPPNP